MSKFDKLTSDVMSHLDRQEATGWYSCHCPVCGEQRTRTGGFLFAHDQITYNCFRGKCDASCTIKEGEYVSRKFKHLMSVMGVKIPVEILTVRRKNTIKELMEDDDGLYKKHFYHEIPIPDGWVPLEECTKHFAPRLCDYFESHNSSLVDVFAIETGPYKGMAAIGMYHGNKFIGAHIKTEHKYISHYDKNSHILYLPERYAQNPVILVEGGMDARALPNAAATLSDHISPEQAYQLRGKPVIMLPDRKGECKFIDQFSDYGWKIAIPDWDEKDLDAAVQKYGKLVAAKKIIDSATDNLLNARVRYKLWSLD